MDNSTSERNICPYKEKCYRKNPIHFSEMAHPHLENLIVDQLDANISIPNKLDFECPDRSLLMEQLRVLQSVMRKLNIQDKTVNTAKTVSKTSTDKNYSTKDSKDLENLKEKIEKHRQAALQKRESKLKDMDTKAAKCDEESAKVISTKRPSPSSSSTSSSKKAKSETETPSESSKANDSSCFNKDFSSSSSLSSGPTVVETLVESKSRAEREKIRDLTIARIRRSGQSVKLCEPGEFALKYALSAPYHYFFNRVEKSKSTHDQQFTVTFSELLDISLGDIVDSLHINFMVEIGWLCLQYLLAAQSAKMTIFCGSVCDSQTKFPPNIDVITVQMPTAYGCHHSKITVLKYSNGGIRIIISTANIYSDDWENRTQGLWMSPHLPPLPDSANPSDGESPTMFKKSFREYLLAYKHPKLIEWEHLIKKADCSSINVFFVASVPGSHRDSAVNSWGHKRLATILSQHATLPPDSPQWTLIAQSSSIGNLGPNFESWVQSNIVSSMSREKNKGLKSNPNFQFIYPSLRNYQESFDCRDGSCCLPYSKKSHEKQEWLTNYLYQWKADETERTKAMPHFKSYTRLSPDQTQIPWFVLTSANLSKGAWGTLAKAGNSLYIMNYEAGVVFLPQFVINQTTFPIKQSNSPDVPVFRLPYDLPLTKYRPNDKPFVSDYLRC